MRNAIIIFIISVHTFKVPINLGNVYDEQASGMSANFVNGVTKVEFGTQYTKSASGSIVTPIPTADPLTPTTNNFGKSIIASTKSLKKKLHLDYKFG